MYTLTLTDIATGWTECLPLLYRSRETVLAAFQRARTLFPFPILGIDTDNGGEFINEDVTAYCEQEQITFTRGRPYQKKDQCFVEQKNGAIVRQVVGYDRFVGEHAYRQLTELYRALRLYVNCFQPSTKMQAKQREGNKVRCTYDPAKTPLQRLLLSGVLPAQKQHELARRHKPSTPSACSNKWSSCNRPSSAVLPVISLVFQTHPQPPPCLCRGRVYSRCVSCRGHGSRSGSRASYPVPRAGEEKTSSGLATQPERPLYGEWEQITTWLIAHPERSSGDIFRELQRLSPGRYHPLQIRTLQRGMRKIRAHLLATFEEQWQEELINQQLPASVPPAESAEGLPSMPDHLFNKPYG